MAVAESGVSSVPSGRELGWLVLRLILGLSVIVLVVGGLSYVARDECAAWARGFVASFGYWGMALGAALADAVHFPIPPQFYMFLAVASGASVVRSFTAIALASALAGSIGFGISRLIGRVELLARKTERYQFLLVACFERYGYRAAVVASLLPIPYSMLCYLSGLSRLPYRFALLVTLLRIPKLAIFYALIYAGWLHA